MIGHDDDANCHFIHSLARCALSRAPTQVVTCVRLTDGLIMSTSTTVAATVALAPAESSACTELFYSASRGIAARPFEQLLAAAYAEDPLATLKIVAHIRDRHRGGKGERALGRLALVWLATHHPQALVRNLHRFVAHFGRFDDVEVLMGTRVERDVLELLRAQLVNDLATLERSRTSSSNNNNSNSNSRSSDLRALSTCAKWIPSERKARGATHNLRTKLCRHMKLSSKTLRTKFLTPLRAALAIPEARMCANEWDAIDFDSVPRVAMSMYGKPGHAFERHAAERFAAWQAMQLPALETDSASASAFAHLVRSPRDHVHDVIARPRYNAIALPDERE